MVLVERVEYELTEGLFAEAAAAVVPIYVPKTQPGYSPQTIKNISMAGTGCLYMFLLCFFNQMPADVYVYIGICFVCWGLLAAGPRLVRSLDNALIRFTGYSQGLVRDRMLKDNASLIGMTVRWEFDDEGFRTVLPDRVRRVSWTDLKRVRVRGAFWLLFVGREQLLLPDSSLTDHARAFLRHKLDANRVKVVER